jgi:hypothetical protein
VNVLVSGWDGVHQERYIVELRGMKCISMGTDNIDLEQLLKDKQYNAKSSFTDENDINLYSNINHNCEYYDLEEFQSKVSNFSKQLSFMSFNIRSLPNKFNEFKDFLDDVNMDKFKFSIIGLQEIWSVPLNTNFSIPGYSKLEFKVRESQGRSCNNTGGGVGLFIDEKYEYQVLEEFSLFIPHVFESIFIKVKSEKDKFIIVGNVYRPNNGPLANINRFNGILSELLTSIKNCANLKRNDGIVLLGDYNINLLQSLNHNPTNDYLEILLDNQILPLIVLPSRITQKTATVIDHISTNIKDNMFDCGIIFNNISDHHPVFYIRHMTIDRIENLSHKTRLINEETKATFKNLLKDLKWNGVLNENRPEIAFKIFFSTFNDFFNLSFPEVEKKPNKNKTPLNPWMTKGLLKSRRRKEKLFSRKIKQPTNKNKDEFRRYNELYVKVYRQARTVYYNAKFKEYNNNIRQTWNTINELLGRKRSKDSLPSYFKSNQHILSNKCDIAEGFNEFFANIGPELATNISSSNMHFKEFLGDQTSQNFVFGNVTENIILENVKKLKSKNSSGPDNISSKLLKEIIHLIVKPLSHLFNLSFKTGYIPIELKTAKVIPVYKTDDPHSFNNYRPISLLSTFSKLLEKIAATQMFRYLNKYNILYKHQYGFRTGHSTTHAMLQFLDKIYKGFNKLLPEYTLAIFIDLKKAFDTCDFDILLHKLNHYGFRGVANIWFENYLKNRRQFTSVDGVSSSYKTLLTGVPQGSVLGPLLFLILINDLANFSDLFYTILFADDTTLQISSCNIRELYEKANNELKKAADWFKGNKLTLNVSKTKYILFNKKANYPNLSDFSLKIDNTEIERIGESCTNKYFKFVGILLDENLSWSYHISHVRGKLASANYALSKLKNILPMKIKLNIYNSLFKSHLEYGLLCWGGAKQGLLKPLTILQKKSIRYIYNVKNNTHTSPLFKESGILKFQELAEYQQGCFMFKIINSKCPTSFQHLFQRFHGANRSKNFILDVPKSKALEHLPTYYLPKTWNKLNLDLKRETIFRNFKSKIKKTMISKY